jgi:hypothetical protein
MTIAKLSCITCKHFNGEVLVCALKGFVMESSLANLDRSNWKHYSGKFNNPNACLDYEPIERGEYD